MAEDKIIGYINIMNFKEWFIIVEGKEEKALALELAGDAGVLSSLSEVIPKNQRKLILCCYWLHIIIARIRM